MKLSDAQFGALSTLQQFGPNDAIEVIGPPRMDGTREVKLQWNGASGATLGKLEAAGLVSVNRKPLGRPRNAVGKPGRPRRGLTISITDAGRAALASSK